MQSEENSVNERERERERVVGEKLRVTNFWENPDRIGYISFLITFIDLLRNHSSSKIPVGL